MILKTYKLGALTVNCYVLINEQTGEAVAIDVGANPSFLALEELKNNFKIKAILLTHGHFDHVGGVGYFYDKGVDVYIGKYEDKMIDNDELNLSAVFGEPIKKFKVKTLQDGDVINLAGINFEVIATPGHTKGSVTYKVNDMLFCGDTLFKGSFGRVDFPTGNVKELINSAKKLFNIKGATLYSGHGETTTTDIEKHTNPINLYD